MRILKSIAQVIFGKDADIFNKKGQVEHKLPEQKWQAWNARYTTSSEYNWRNHRGQKRSGTKKEKRPEKQNLN